MIERRINELKPNEDLWTKTSRLNTRVPEFVMHPKPSDEVMPTNYRRYRLSRKENTVKETSLNGNRMKIILKTDVT